MVTISFSAVYGLVLDKILKIRYFHNNFVKNLTRKKAQFDIVKKITTAAAR